MSGESERIEEVGKYIEATIAEIDDHTAVSYTHLTLPTILLV